MTGSPSSELFAVVREGLDAADDPDAPFKASAHLALKSLEEQLEALRQALILITDSPLTPPTTRRIAQAAVAESTPAKSPNS